MPATSGAPAASAMPAHRYAIYLAPPEPFREFGGRWLGRCAETGDSTPAPDADADADDPRRAAWVRAPAHYGLHATLKPPFRLADGTGAAALDSAARAFAGSRKPFNAPLALQSLRGFIAWCLHDDADGCREMHALADAAVEAFDQFRAPPTADEMARRKPEQLSDAQRRMLEAWGYPYVFDTFTFHITLTGMLDAVNEDAALGKLAASGGAMMQTPMRVDRVSVFVQPTPGADFLVARHYGFDGTIVDGAGARWLDV